MKTFNLFKSGLLAVCALMMVSCSDKEDSPNPQEEKTITAIVSSDNNFSILKAAVVRAGLAATLDGTGPFTVFAPTNAAFQKAGFSNEASIATVPVETLKSILLYHTVATKATAGSLPTASNTAVKTVQGADIYVTKSAAGVYVNGAMVTKADVTAKNGVIHVIDNVLMPPTGNIVQVLSGKPDYSFLVAAVVRASQGAVNVKAVLEANGPLTVFAPTNQAFIQAGFASVQAVQAADPATLTSILTGHVVEGRIFSNAVQNNLSVKTLAQNNIVFGVGSSVTVKGNGNTTAATVTSVNLTTTNGVIHTIDKVLLP
ncbi:MULTISPECIES: fasciclin domain-containing protein [Sphingobacterium]|uniref:fasciclin domain-containing protein n=1 Tax=Sphingobacterium TaxID=28453 RepID=UPI0013DC9605|nr:MULTISPECIES: fasciclin domain-containing protein [unclassified Sphingobacterium]